MQRREYYVVTAIMRNIIGQAVRANMPVCYSQTYTDSNRNYAENYHGIGVVCATEATRISLMQSTCFCCIATWH